MSDQQRRERGAVALEFALVVPLLIALVFGIAEFGRAYSAQTTLSNAARDGVRVMALQDDPGAARDAAQASATGLDISASSISVSPSTCEGGGATATAEVVITHEMDFITGLFGAGVTLTGKGTMRCNG